MDDISLRDLINIVSKLYEENEQGMLTTDLPLRKKYTDSQGKTHRVGGPASIIGAEGSDTLCYYYIHGKKHRIDGPACYSRNGTVKQYYIDNKIITPNTIIDDCKKEFFANKKQYENFIMQVLIWYSMLGEGNDWHRPIIHVIMRLKYSTIHDKETIKNLNVILAFVEYLEQKNSSNNE